MSAVVSVGRDIVRATNIIEFARELGIEPDELQARLLTATEVDSLTLAGRQFGKTTCMAITTLHHLLYSQPHRPMVVCISPSESQSVGFGKRVSDYYHALGLPKLQHSTQTNMVLPSGARLLCCPSSDATVRGVSAVTLLVCDEAGDVPFEMLAATRPMTATTDGQFAAIGSARGAPDHWFRHEWEHGKGYLKLSAKASECSRISKQYLARELERLGPTLFAAEFENAWIDDQSSFAFSSHLLEGAFRRDFELFHLG